MKVLCQHPYFVEFLHKNFHNVRNYLFANSCMSLMFTSQYSKVAQNNQILNLRALDRAHATTWIINIEALFIVFQEAPIANSEIMYFRTWRKILRSVWSQITVIALGRVITEQAWCEHTLKFDRRNHTSFKRTVHLVNSKNKYLLLATCPGCLSFRSVASVFVCTLPVRKSAEKASINHLRAQFA